jgi:hypothetical protein
MSDAQPFAPDDEQAGGYSGRPDSAITTSLGAAVDLPRLRCRFDSDRPLYSFQVLTVLPHFPSFPITTILRLDSGISFQDVLPTHKESP